MKTDILVIGSGIAGLTTALEAANHSDVVIITKDSPGHCNSMLAQGGIAAAVSPQDSPAFHAQDTLMAGAGICEREIVSLLTQEAPDIIKYLRAMGVHFDTTSSGELALAQEGAHCIPRVLHHGDDTGAEIWNALYKKVKETKRITLMPNAFAMDLICQSNTCLGVKASTPQGFMKIYAQATVLATGGLGQIYGRTTNALLSTGDGLALAWRAGAELSDMEFIQFHPTALDIEDCPYFLISEAVRGAGAVLVNNRHKLFMRAYHSMADLAPRDVVSRAIMSEQQQGRRVYLDARALGSEFRQRFPTISRKLATHGINPLYDLIPVTPAVHFAMGGINTDGLGRTTICNLYACGEVARTGVHGANRLASNSLLEGLVFGRRVAEAIQKDRPNRLHHQSQDLRDLRELTFDPLKIAPLDSNDPRLKCLQSTMWSNVGIFREEVMLTEAREILEQLGQDILPQEAELNNMLQVAKLIISAAKARLESRGSHYRLDYPLGSPAWADKHFILRRNSA